MNFCSFVWRIYLLNKNMDMMLARYLLFVLDRSSQRFIFKYLQHSFSFTLDRSLSRLLKDLNSMGDTLPLKYILKVMEYMSKMLSNLKISVKR